jgi:hypothetical protein
MLCVSLNAYTRSCGGVTGGISDIAIYDPNDLNFTQSAAVAGVAQKYSAVAERDGVDSPSVFVINFQTGEAEMKITESVTGCATKYDFEWIFQLPDLSQNLTTFQQALDAAGCCCGIGVIMRLNSGKIFVAGERYVNDDIITRFTVKQDGSDGGTGKLFNDLNGMNIHFKASYSRNLYEYSGTWASIVALTESSGS